MSLFSWDEVDLEQLSPLTSRQVIHGARITVARLALRCGAVVPEHSHENEQITMLQQGRLLFRMEGAETVIASGQMMLIPPHVPHSVEALEDSVAVDVFSPIREDWIRGDDAYLRGR